MDIKLASVTKEKNYFTEHREFLHIASSKELFVKIVVSAEIDREEFRQALDLIAEIDPEIPLVLQPRSEENKEFFDPSLFILLKELRSLALSRLKQVKIIPRWHKVLGLI